MAFFSYIFYWLTRPFIKANIVSDSDLSIDSNKPINYVLVTDSLTDKLALQQACKKQGLPSPFKKLHIGEKKFNACLGVKSQRSIFCSKHRHQLKTLEQGQALLKQVENTSQDVQFVPVMICWGRAPGIEKNSANRNAKIGIKDLIADTLQASWIRKFFIVLFSGRHNFVRISKPVSLLEMVNKHGSSEDAAHKLLRVARIHFERQRIVATGPKIQNRNAMFNSLLASPALKKALQEEMKSKNISMDEAKKNAIKLLDEIAGDYNESYIRLGSRILTWLWNKIYNGIRVHNADNLRDLAQKGHEIVYVPCHRSHMDYLLLTYVIHHEGLVPPHIAAGINLNFWPAGPVFRKAGAFFIRRSFKGNKLYSAVFREYLSQLFIKGYPVKYYTEGGRSRTGRLLQPKTGMIAMTVQSMLRGVERPITLVPVYIGYEHVMEVNTYLSELKGKNKESESVFAIFKAIKNLKNYGHGDVNFGTPIHLNEVLNQHAPDWRELIDPEEVVKPSWLTPVVNIAANQIMSNINDAAVLNTVNLSALTLLTSDNHALPRTEMQDLIDLYVQLQKQVPYAENIQTPSQSASEIINEAIQLEKVQVESDEFGTIVKLDDKSAILMSYYRNNVIHLFALPAVVAGEIVHQKSTSIKAITAKINDLLPLLANEMFITLTDIEQYARDLVAFFEKQNLVVNNRGKIAVVKDDSKALSQLSLLAKIMKDTLQRYALTFNRLEQVDGIQRSELEKDCQQLAKRLLTLHDIKAPEYFDKKMISSFVSCLREHKYVEVDEAGLMHLTELGKETSEAINSLMSAEVLQSLQALG
ncbi:MAG: glycerol-3-phosphate 1-O-acyltransferase PlsB [Gammaproteobacteria bacterium]|nr:glycerol-3-phosphate 1-O-acyltransferase PlsB [Gammaproteobacteria bacterium]